MSTPLQQDLKRIFHGASWALLLRGLLALAVGLIIIIRPLDSIAGLALVIAFWAIFSGLTSIVHAFELKAVLSHWWVILLSGLVSVGFGVAAMYYYPGLSLTFAIVLFVWWLMITGIFGIWAAMQEKRLGLPWGWAAFFGVLSIAAAVFGLLAPPATLAAIMGLIAGFSLIGGVMLLLGAFKLRSMA